MSISTGNSKLGDGVANVSTIPMLDCANCSSCMNKCYAKKFYKMYPSVRKSWTENSILAKENPLKYFQDIIDHCNKHQTKYFRWHVGGDILDQSYLDNMMLVAAICHKTKFVCFTKRFDLEYSQAPKNLKIFFSVWPQMQLPLQPIGVSLAWTQDGTETRIPKGSRNCPNQCKGCITCWNSKRDVVFHLHR
jgi:hypothetical protein